MHVRFPVREAAEAMKEQETERTMGEPIRVLQVLGGTNLGGAESRTMDLYRNMDRERVQFDFAVHSAERGFFDEEIENLGGHIYRLPRFRAYNWLPYRKAWKAFFREHPGYACVHGHMTSTASIYLPLAKAAGVTVTAAHARSAGVDKGPRGLLTKLLRLPLAKRADYCLAASALAGEAVFGKKAMAQGKVHVLPNGIQTPKYQYDPAVRERLRRELSLEQAFVVGHVGRFHPCKNHDFLIDIFTQVLKKRPDSRLLLLGEGSGMEPIRQKARELGIEEKVCFLGNRSNACDYYQAMDCFVFPSFYEGFPGTVLEAQAAGLPCIVSGEITREVAVTELVTFLPLSESAKAWAEQALKPTRGVRRGRLAEIEKSGYDAAIQAKVMQRFYETGKLES